MRISEVFKKKTVLSFEVFPPKRDGSIESVYRAIDGLSGLAPDYISVTYGAGGSANHEATAEIAAAVKQRYGIEGVAHLTGLYLNRDEVPGLLEQYHRQGIENLLVLRGDEAPGLPKCGDFQYADELISFIGGQGDVGMSAACYPEGHPESPDVIGDIRHVKQKVDAGAEYLVSQMVFDNQHFYRFRERVALAGVEVPIQVGIMPVVNKRQISRIVSLCGASMPDKFLKMMDRYEHKPEAIRDAGIAYAVNQIVDLITQGVDGIHLYTMNDPQIAQRICQAIASLLDA